MKSIIIASDRSNSGKTTISIALMRILSKVGKVRGYKIGPDFIDPKFHEVATGYSSINLDPYLMGDDLKIYFEKYAGGFDFGIIEGVMGLYDGMGGRFSTYDTSIILDCPIIAVIDCSFNSTTSSAILYGLKFFKNANIKGVIFNNVASPSHFRDCAINLPDGIKNLGYVKHDSDMVVKSRHLGLYLPDGTTEEKIRKISEIVEENLDIEALISIMKDVEVNQPVINHDENIEKPSAAVAYDQAFSFYYKNNLDLLSRKFILNFFSPIRNEYVKDAELLYFGGGYPELFGRELERSSITKSWLRKSSDENRTVIAECGGLMYLSSNIEVGNDNYKMAGIFNAEISMNSKLTIGYTELKSERDNPIIPPGDIIKGHEFHKSKVINYQETTVFHNDLGKGLGDGKDGMIYNNTLATYSHFMYSGREKFLKMINSSSK